MHLHKSELFKGETKYLVKWVGYPSSENTWEPLDHLDHAQELLDEFEKNYQLQASKRKKAYEAVQVILLLLLLTLRNLWEAQWNVGLADMKQKSMGGLITRHSKEGIKISLKE